MISLGFTGKNVGPIGLDIGHGSVKMVQLSRNSRVLVLAAEKTRIEDESADNPGQRREQITSSIKEILSRGRFEGRGVVIALPNEKLHITSLRLAEMNDEQTGQAVRDEAKERFGLASYDDVVRYLPVGQVKQGDDLKNELVLFAAGGQAVREHIELAEQAGLVPVGLDPMPCALFRAFDRLLRREADWQQTLVFIDVGQCYTTVVFGRSGEIGFVKEIRIGTQRFDEQISDKLGVTTAEAQVLRAALRSQRKAGEAPVGVDTDEPAVQTALDVPTRQVIVDAVGTVSQELAREISLCFKYYTVTFRGKRVERAFFAGGGAYENVLLNVLRRQLAVEVEVAEPFRGFDMTDVNFTSERRGSHCEWTAAVGLALKGFNE